METRWTYEVLMHDAYGSAGHWYRDHDPKTCETYAFATEDAARVEATKRYPANKIRTTILDR
jgi:hypothetical protein